MHLSSSHRPRALPLAWRLSPCVPQVLHIGKACAYYPDRRRLGEASVRVPVDAAAAGALAAACGKLRSLRLCLGAGDVLPEGLARLSQFSQLDRCALVRAGLTTGQARHRQPLAAAWRWMGRALVSPQAPAQCQTAARRRPPQPLGPRRAVQRARAGGAARASGAARAPHQPRAAPRGHLRRASRCALQRARTPDAACCELRCWLSAPDQLAAR